MRVTNKHIQRARINLEAVRLIDDLMAGVETGETGSDLRKESAEVIEQHTWDVVHEAAGLVGLMGAQTWAEHRQRIAELNAARKVLHSALRRMKPTPLRKKR